MKNILITGASGNAGLETIKYLAKVAAPEKFRVYAGVRDLLKDGEGGKPCR